ncbi:(2Fe-2S)-binding protein [Jatrophihabitans fulvus]
MYVCICHAVTDDEIEDAVDAGADSVAAVGLSTRAGTTCGTCHDHIDDIVAERCGPCPLASLRVA